MYTALLKQQVLTNVLYSNDIIVLKLNTENHIKIKKPSHHWLNAICQIYSVNTPHLLYFRLARKQNNSQYTTFHTNNQSAIQVKSTVFTWPMCSRVLYYVLMSIAMMNLSISISIIARTKLKKLKRWLTFYSDHGVSMGCRLKKYSMGRKINLIIAMGFYHYRNFHQNPIVTTCLCSVDRFIRI